MEIRNRMFHADSSLYKKARAGLIAEFTGVSAPYEAPLMPAMALDGGALSLDACCERLLAHLSQRLA